MEWNPSCVFSFFGLKDVVLTQNLNSGCAAVLLYDFSLSHVTTLPELLHQQVSTVSA